MYEKLQILHSGVIVRTFFALLAVLSITPAALAHDGHGVATGFLSGAAHPFSGLDHLLAMLAVGVWASTMRRPLALAMPATFPLLMALGALFAFSGVQIPQVEAGVAASVLVLGMILAVAWRAPTGIALTLVAAFGFLHGYAHGTEISALASAALYAGGFLIATVALHTLGMLLGYALARNARIVKLIGLTVAATGFWLLGAQILAA